MLFSEGYIFIENLLITFSITTENSVSNGGVFFLESTSVNL